jgi:molecular chaperone DnaJ
MNLYDVLGLAASASLNDIKRAYRRLARQYHPRVNPGDQAAELRFRQIVRAFETLSDAEQRRRYDVTGEIAPQVVGASYGFEGFDFTLGMTSPPGASTFGDLFGDLLREPEAQPGVGPATAGADLHAAVRLGFIESIRGAERQVTVARQVACRTCGGTGALPVPQGPCPQCHGGGLLRSARGHMVFTKPCARCGGTGQLRFTACRTCAAQGIEIRIEALVVPLPPGVADGSQIRVAGKGHAGARRGPCGDLFVRVDVEPHPLFRREGDDLHIQVPVAVHEAALGARIDVPTPEGPARMRVPPGAQSGQCLRLSERGSPSPRGGPRGDLVVEVRIVLPRLVDERSKDLLREFGRINQEDVRKDLML